MSVTHPHLQEGGAALGRAPDIRTERTRKALIGAMYALLEEYSWEEITVLKVCEKAGIKKSHFLFAF